MASHVAATHGNRQFSRVRILVFIIVWSAAVVAGGCTQTEASRAKDVFKRGYLKSFSTYSRKHLMDHYAIVNDGWLKGGTEPTLNNFPNWNIVPDGVLLSFEDYQVSSHSFGQPEFVVPFSAMRDTIQQNVLRTLAVSQ